MSASKPAVMGEFLDIQVPPDVDHLLWASSGVMSLTGRASGPPLGPTGNPAGLATSLLRAWSDASFQRIGYRPDTPDATVLSERAAIAGLKRRGDISCGGATRILPTATDLIVLSLARDSDFDLLPALTSTTEKTDPWQLVAEWLLTVPARDAVSRARLLGLPAARVPEPGEPESVEPASRTGVVAQPGAATIYRERPRVLDLSSLWAGPLCANLLGLAGADVVKVESTKRLDGARNGPSRFFDVLHGGHRSVTLDLTSPTGRRRLGDLAHAADVIIEASRPRALRQLGLDAAALVNSGVIWVSITAYGREVDDGMRVGYGDDVAVSAGLTARDGHGAVFCGDAIADPLAGLAAAAACAHALTTDTSWFLDVSMHDVSRIAASLPTDSSEKLPVAAPPRARLARARAAYPGQHTREVLASW